MNKEDIKIEKSEKTARIIINIVLMVCVLSVEVGIIRFISYEIGAGMFLTQKLFFNWALILVGVSVLTGICFMRLWEPYSIATCISRIGNPCSLGFVMIQCVQLANIKGWDKSMEKTYELIKK